MSYKINNDRKNIQEILSGLMDPKLPILIIIPHGGYTVPAELADNITIDEFDLFVQSDTCANDLFNFTDKVTKTLKTTTSRLLVDLDRKPSTEPKKEPNGVIKKVTLNEKEIFKKNVFPNELAVTNILRRYYHPFHSAIDMAINSKKIKLILDCHTVMASAPRISSRPGEPRPIIQLENVVEYNGRKVKTCEDELVEKFRRALEAVMQGEEGTVTEKCIHKQTPCKGYILQKFGRGPIPMVRLSLSKALFLNDQYFSYEFLKVDTLRISELRDKIWKAVSGFFMHSF